MTDRPARVCVVGSLNMDLCVRAPRLPRPGETVLGSTYATFPGGKGANQAVASARLGAHVAMVGAVGDDLYGRELLAVLDAEGVNREHVGLRTSAPTGVALITVTDDPVMAAAMATQTAAGAAGSGAAHDNTIVVAPGANATLSRADIQAARETIATADVVLLQLEVPAEAVLEAAKIAREARATVVLNASPAPASIREFPREIIALTDVLIVNRAEGARLVGLEPGSVGVGVGTDAGRLVLRLADLGTAGGPSGQASGPHTVVMTLGPQGCMVVHRGRPMRVPTINVRTIDSVGAGDAFAGVIAASWLPVREARGGGAATGGSGGWDDWKIVRRALVTAAVAGALATTKDGAIPSLPHAHEVHDVIAAHARELELS
jgi:ribokinase